MYDDLKVSARHKSTDDKVLWHVNGINARRIGKDLRDALNASENLEKAVLLREETTDEEVE